MDHDFNHADYTDHVDLHEPAAPAEDSGAHYADAAVLTPAEQQIFDHLTQPAAATDPAVATQPDVNASPAQPPVAPGPETLGTPVQDGSFWASEGENGYCGPESIAMVLNEFGLHDSQGNAITKDEVAAFALAHGDVLNGGTGWGHTMTIQQVETVLSDLGVPSHTTTGNEVMLEQALATGHNVLLQVDAERIWHDQPDANEPNHVLMITGIDLKQGVAYLNDPGTPNGREECIRIEDLMQAWAPGDYQMIVTEAAPAIHQADQAPVDPVGQTAPQPTPAASQALADAGPVLLPIVLDPELLAPSSRN